jgi:hypothetical protein
MIRIINIILTLGVFVAAYFLYNTIQEPIRFNAEFKKRNDQVIEKLKYIRDLELAYKDVHDKFAGSFEDLIRFAKEDSMAIIRIIGDPDQLDAYGNPVPVIREVIKIPVRDTLLNPKWPLESLANIPTVEGEKFSIETGELERGRINVPVFEIAATYPQMLKGMNKNYIDPNLVRKVGSLEEPSYNGNWEGK